MARWWIRAALGILWLGAPLAARAQYLPASGGPAPLADPAPMTGGAGPAMAPGAMPGGPPFMGPGCMPGGPPMMGPGGPPPGPPLTAPPENTPNAFVGEEEIKNFSSCRCYCQATGWTFTIGTAAYKQERVGSLPLAVLDPQNLDTGNPPPAGSPLIQATNDIATAMGFGVKATLAYQWKDAAVELSGFYIPQSRASNTLAVPGRIDLPFFNTPLGFEGDNGMWLQADTNTITLQTTLASGEVNYRTNMPYGLGQFLVGLRYLDVQERFSIFTDDDGLTVVPPDPFRMATYSVRTHNHILAPQLGFNYEQEMAPWLSVGFFAKGAWGANYADVDLSLTRGDGFQGFLDHRSKTQFGQLYELGMFMDVYFNEHIKLRAGYNALWVLNVAEAIQQVNFDLSQQGGTPTYNGNLFFHGPSIELSFLF